MRDKASPRSEVPAPLSRAFLGGPPVGESRLLAAPPLSPADGDLAPGMAAVYAAPPSLLPLLDVVRESSPYFRLNFADVLTSCELLPKELFE